MSGALEGLTVLDFTAMLAGPYVTVLLADQGANVIKVESLDGDYTRQAGPYLAGDVGKQFSGYFQSINRNKKSIAIDLKQSEGLSIIRDIAPSVDVVVENFRAGVMQRLGLDYRALKKINPKLVYASVRGFGDVVGGSSPYIDWHAYDVIAQAMGGIVGITGTGSGECVKVGPGVGDIFPGTIATVGILAAVYHATKTGQGQYVDVAMVDSILALCERIIYQRSYGEPDPTPQGSRHPFLVPFGLIRCKDGSAAIACHTDAFWATLCRLIGTPDSATSGPLATVEGRRANQDAVYELIENYTVTKTKTELLHLFGGQIPFGPVYTASDIMTDPHFRERNMLYTVNYGDDMEPVSFVNSPIKMSVSKSGYRRRAPLLSEHATTILTGIGYSSEKIANLREQKIIL